MTGSASRSVVIRIRSQDLENNAEGQTSPKVLGNFTNEMLEGQLADQEFSGLLAMADKVYKPQDECIERGTYLIPQSMMVLGGTCRAS